MGIPVKILVFEGPLDLLLHLIDKSKLNIYDIPISEVTDQYLEYIDCMEINKMEIMSEFIEMAAILINIKSRTLLPEDPKDDEEEELDPRQVLIDKLIEYKKFKYISAQLKGMQLDALKVVFKDPTIPDEVASYMPEIDPKQIIGDLDFSKLYLVFQSVMKKKSDKIDPIRSKFGEIRKEEYTVQEKINYIFGLSQDLNSLNFRELLEFQSGKVEVIVTFLAVLELMKMGVILIVQGDHFEEIRIEFRKGIEWKLEK